MGLPPLSSSKRDYSSFGKYAYARQRLDEGAGIQSRFMSPEGRAFATSTLSSTPDPMASMETMVGRPAKESANARGLVVDSLSRPISALDSLKNLPKAEPELKPLISGETYMAPVGAIKTGELTEKQQKEADKRTRQALRTGVGRSIAERVLEYPAEGLERFVDAATFGLVSRNNLNVPEREDYERSLAGTVGEFAGYVAPGVAIERAAASALRPAIGGLSRTAQRAITGGVAGTAEVAAQEAGDALFRGESFDPENIALGAGIGAGANVVIPPVLTAINKLFNRIRNPQAQRATQEILALPEPRQRGNVNTAVTDDVIYAQETTPRGLPEPTLLEATRARVSPNPYRVKYERLIEEAKNHNFTPGRELEELESLWSQMADRTDPGLFELIDLAYPPSRITPDLVSRARETQRMRDVAGVPSLVRTSADRYPGGTIARTAGAQTTPKIEGRLDARISPSSLNVEPPRITEAVEQPRLQSQIPDVAERPSTEFPTRQPLAEGLETLRTQLEPEPLGISPFAREQEYGFRDPSDTRGHIVTKTKKDPLSTPEALDEFYRRSVDNIQRINQFDKYFERMTGQKLSPADRAYMLAMNSRGSDVISHTILTENLVDAQGNYIGKALKDITKQIPKRNVVDFEDYLIAKHAETRMARGEKVYAEESGMTLDKVAQKIQEYESRYPEFVKIADEWHDFSNKLGEAWLVDTGIISRETWDAWREANPFWVPMKRFFEDIEKPRLGGAKRGFAGQSSPVKSYSKDGSERKIISPLESMIEYVDQFVKTAKRNEVMQTIIRNAQRHPEQLADWVEIAPIRDAAKKTSLDDINSILQKDGVDGLLERLDEINLEFTKPVEGFKEGQKGNILTALVDGEPVQIKVHDPAFLEALTNLTPQGRSKVIEATRKVTAVMKVLTTGINPVFSLTRNIFYDIPQAFVFSKTTNNPIRFAWDLMDGVISTFGNRPLYQAYKAMGGGHSSSVAADRNLLAQSRRALLPQKERFDLLKKAFSGMENIANIIESAPRLGEFKRITRAGGNTYESRIKGLFEAQDVTVNFKRHGDLTREADAIFPYLNAAVQGTDKLIRAFKDNPVQAGVKAFTSITIPTLALYALNHDNPDYQKLSNYNKDRFFLFPTKSGKFIKIPKPRELGVIFGALVERSMRLLKEQDPDAFRDFMETVKIAFQPPGLPIDDIVQGNFIDAGANMIRDTIAGPFVDIAMNENFAGAPIVPGYLEGASPRHQYDVNTSEVSKRIGNILNISPKQIDHLIKSYGGFVGQLGIPATTEGASVGDTLIRQVTADPVFSTDATRYFYDLKEEYDTMYQDMRITGEVVEGYNDGARKYLGQVANVMNEITKRLRALDASDLPRDEKNERKRELTELRNQLAREAYLRVKYGQEGGGR